MEITSKQRKTLEKLANSLSPIIIVGANGLTPTLQEKVVQCLTQHELIKIKFNDFKDEKAELSNKIAQDADANLVRIIGNTAIFYRQNDDPEKRQIKL